MTFLLLAVKGVGGMTVHARVPKYSAIWPSSSFFQPYPKTDAAQGDPEHRGERIVCVGGEDKRQSEGETTQQYVHRQYWGMYTLNAAKALVMAGLFG